MNTDSSAARSPTSSASRADRRRLASQTLVLEAASELFSTNGFFETSMASIAERADVAVGTLYNLFKSKDALYRELVHRIAVEFSERLTAAIHAAETPGRAVERFVETLFEIYREKASMLRLFYRISGRHVSVRAALDENSQHAFDATLREFSQVIQKGIDAGEFDAGTNSIHAALAIQAVSNEMFSLYLRDPSERTGDQELKEVLAMVRHGILASNPNNTMRNKE